MQQKKLYDKSMKQVNGLLKKQEQLLRGMCGMSAWYIWNVCQVCVECLPGMCGMSARYAWKVCKECMEYLLDIHFQVILKSFCKVAMDFLHSMSVAYILVTV